MKGTLFLAALAFATLAMASPNGGPLGDFEAHVDVGSPRIAGYATYNGASQVYTLSAGGVNLWAKRDEFHFAYRRMKGDFIVQAQMEFVGAGTDPHRKGGIMARAAIADFDSAYVDGVPPASAATTVTAPGTATASSPCSTARSRAATPSRRRWKPPRTPPSCSSSA